MRCLGKLWNNSNLGLQQTKTVIFESKRSHNVQEDPDILHTKFLGTDIDVRLLWTVHILISVTKLNSAVCAIRKINQLVNHFTPYYALFESVKRYDLSVWSSVAQICLSNKT